MEAIIILAGGSGTRLWPASTPEKPKQFLSLGGGESFLRLSAERGLAVNPKAEIVVVTHARYLDSTIRDLAPCARGGAAITVLPEPEGRNTAPAIAFAALYLQSRLPPESRALILSADHLIRPQEAFIADAAKAGQLGSQGYVAVFGIPPSDANTGYGYIEAADPVSGLPGFTVRSFKEKPDAGTAAKYVAAGNYYWNSGMFLFSLKTLEEEFAAHAPEVWLPFRQLAAKAAGEKGRMAGTDGGELRVWGEDAALRDVYAKLPSISVDYAVMEKSSKTAMVRASFEWNDVGSWDEAARLYPDEAPAVFAAEASGNRVFSDIPVALCGVEDLVVVIRGGRALVMKKGSSQLVREAAKALGGNA
ncbi:MAG: mannose-1-phosphate guanylyltransferase [Spirochaetales bacterium]|jgi:mannose-1-phosphate guanylyltransferase/mannose-6-phosphate isomerase|nr:mannose-1-phosphate guanylyltransferase [Spirochaetales bacterium]